MRNHKAKSVALGGVLFALAIALSLMESAITPLLGLMPGVKLGLSNIVVMYALVYLGFRQAFLLMVLKALFSLSFFGVTAGFLSGCGGIFSLLVMALAQRLGATHYILSVCGALAHNAGQLLGASVILSSALALTYMPVLMVSGLVMGGITATGMKVLLPALKRVGVAPQK
ncbi:MAG: Gx transporter family protein [Firmicutes bacterium]|nr:Gx transporter family protein [Bacillota bacterium]